METTTLKKDPLHFDPDQFFRGFLAALTLQLQKNTLQGTRSELHQAFYGAVSAAEERSFIRLDDLDIDFDPLYEVSPWFDRALTRAQRDLMVSFPNPSYERIQICFDRDEADEVLKQVGSREEFVNLADVFISRLHA